MADPSVESGTIAADEMHRDVDVAKMDTQKKGFKEVFFGSYDYLYLCTVKAPPVSKGRRYDMSTFPYSPPPQVYRPSTRHNMIELYMFAQAMHVFSLPFRLPVVKVALRDCIAHRLNCELTTAASRTSHSPS
jgi:hypothetical protein